MERRDFLKMCGAAGLCAAFVPTCRAAGALEEAATNEEGTRTMADLKYVTYCGLYCKLCANIARIPQQAANLRDTLRKEGWDEHVLPGWEGGRQFWDVLGELEHQGELCPGCRGGCGWPQCPMRKCAQEKGLEVCSQCDEYPCEHVEALARRYPNLIADGMRQREVGLDRWIQEQEARREAGFCYNQIRYSG